MKRIILPALLFSNVLVSKNVVSESIFLSDDGLEALNPKAESDKPTEAKNDHALSPIVQRQNGLFDQHKEVDYTAMYKIYQVESIFQSLQQNPIEKRLLSKNAEGSAEQDPYALSESLLKEAKHHLGKRYVWGAVGPSRFDCSGFTSYVCKKNGITIPRTSIMQAKVGKKVSKKNLKPGDLIFFDTSKHHKGYVNHVGIYLGDHKFIHASSARKKVMISSLNKTFYNNRFKWGRRVGQKQMTDKVH
ncbi:MAG TPA: NlpC/P60 family protein [Epsilonproteobacteria bacterium]|nr:NlpC/P60 family protein [Campylobacterota bacterium]